MLLLALLFFSAGALRGEGDRFGCGRLTTTPTALLYPFSTYGRYPRVFVLPLTIKALVCRAMV